MVADGYYRTTFRLDGRVYHTGMRIEQVQTRGGMKLRAVIEGTPLDGTAGGAAATVPMALDFLNLAMQAEGAEEIRFSQVAPGRTGWRRTA